MNPSGPQRICIVRLSALGDVCLVVPLVRTLQRNFPSAQITWVIGHRAHQLVDGLDGVEFVVIDKDRPLANWRRLRSQPFDAVLAVQASFRAHFLLTAIRAPVRIGFAQGKDLHGLFVNRRVAPGKQHLLDSFLSFATALGAKEPVIDWRLPISDKDHEFARSQMPGDDTFWLAVNPAASKPERNWLPERYAAVINHAQETWKWKVVLTGGPDPAESALCEQVLELIKHREAVTNLIGKTTPKQLAAVLSRARVLLAPDTGPVHIATAMGTPVVGLYAVAPSQLSGPYNSRDLVIDRFPEAVRSLLRTDPATVPWGTRVHTPRAMELIQVKDVLEKLDSLKPVRRTPQSP